MPRRLDLLNTIGGGVAQPKLRIEQKPKGVLMRVAMPTVAAESFRVVLNQQKLTVFGEFRHQPDDEPGRPALRANPGLARQPRPGPHRCRARRRRACACAFPS
ncbi:hypothetical protein ACFQT0_02335 [Hymenobacter humi]|uniref:Uncharacterized protein n=1 Tax=Hymenobacter humi TaxID=1411620 RepID=A0ABW2U0Q1_9BACT